MDRREVVNNPDESDAPDEWTLSRPRLKPIPRDIPPGVPAATSTATPTAAPQLASGPQLATRPMCLYLGPAGERCYRPALDNGFCPAHQPNASPSAVRDQSRARKKKAAATVGIIAALWPVIEELLRQLFRLLR